MSAAGLAVATAGFLLTAAVVVSLWRGARFQPGPARRGYLWFAAAAVSVCANLIIGQAAAFPAGPAAMMLSFADLPAFLVLPFMACGLCLLAASALAPATEPLPSRRSRYGLATIGAYLVDGYLLASALFLAGWATVFGSAFSRYGAGPATFAAELVHPLADLVFLAVILAAAGTAGRRGLFPYLALTAMAVGDSLAVGARIVGSPPGVAAVAAEFAALGLLALAPWGWSGKPSVTPRSGGALWVSAGAAAGAAALAAVLVTVQAMAMGRLPEAVVSFVLGVTVVALGARVVGLVRRVNSWARVWQESGRRFRQLADRTSDVVLICDLEGVIRYASRAVADYGYTPESLAGVPLTDLLHPEDRSGGIEAVRKAVTRESPRPGRYPCRVRAVDRTWRHVESTVSRYREPGGPDQLLVTARDVSAQVELRRQVAHLTFHDPLTGLPNRAYMERRTHDAAAAEDDRVLAGGAGAIAIMLGVDGFAALSEAEGRDAGDLLLAQVARRLRLTISPDDTVARWGDGEFAVLIQAGAGRALGAEIGTEIPDVAERLARSVPSQPFQMGDKDVTVTVSVGVAFGGGPAAQMWRNAELAMSRAREVGGNRVEVFHDGTPGAGRGQPGGPGASEANAETAAPA